MLILLLPVLATAAPSLTASAPGCGSWVAHVDTDDAKVRLYLGDELVRSYKKGSGEKKVVRPIDAEPGTELVFTLRKGKKKVLAETRATVDEYPLQLVVVRDLAEFRAESTVAWDWTGSCEDDPITTWQLDGEEVVGARDGRPEIAVDNGAAAGHYEGELTLTHFSGRVTTFPIAYDVGDVDVDKSGGKSSRAGGPDCHDEDPALPVDAEPSEPDGIDQDCNGKIDDTTVAYDDDGDGFSEEQGDCDDTTAFNAPGLTEVLDCRDNDCDGVVDGTDAVPLDWDDALEGNHDRAGAPAVTGQVKSFRKVLRFRADGDTEWASFYTHDGWTDQWGIRIATMRVGEPIEVLLYDGEDERRRVTVEHDVHEIPYTEWLSNPTGWWSLGVRTKSGNVCPIELELWSG